MTAKIPEIMKAVRFKNAGVVSYEPADVPAIGEGNVLLRVLAAGLCQTDLHIRHDNLGMIARDIILGHEIAGEVVATWSGVSNVEIGDRVVVHPCWACGECRALSQVQCV